MFYHFRSRLSSVTWVLLPSIMAVTGLAQVDPGCPRGKYLNGSTGKCDPCVNSFTDQEFHWETACHSCMVCDNGKEKVSSCNATHNTVCKCPRGQDEGPEGKCIMAPVIHAPMLLPAIARSTRTLTLTWQRPQGIDSSSVLSYEIYMNSSTQPPLTISVVPPKEAYVIEGLVPDTLYSISITVSTSMGESLHSNVVHERTQEAAQTSDGNSSFHIAIVVMLAICMAILISWAVAAICKKRKNACRNRSSSSNGHARRWEGGHSGPVTMPSNSSPNRLATIFQSCCGDSKRNETSQVDQSAECLRQVDNRRNGRDEANTLNAAELVPINLEGADQRANPTVANADNPEPAAAAAAACDASAAASSKLARADKSAHQDSKLENGLDIYPSNTFNTLNFNLEKVRTSSGEKDKETDRDKRQSRRDSSASFAPPSPSLM